MELSEDLRARLWPTERWVEELVTIQTETLAVADPWQRSAQAFGLGLVFEALLPDRQWAIGLYEKAWKATGDHRRALVRARALCRELSRPDLAARLAEIEAERFGEPELLGIAGRLWIDVGERARAEAVLAKAQAAKLAGPDLLDAIGLVALGPGAAPIEATRSVARAQTAPGPKPAATELMRAARLWVLVDPSSLAGLTHARRAAELDPGHEGVDTLLLPWLERERAWPELARLVDRRAEAAESAVARIEILRRGAATLVLRADEPHLGAALVERALALAYDERLADIPAHIAMVSLLAKASGMLGEPARLLELVDRGLASDLGDDERVFLAGQGLGVAAATGDTVAASRFRTDLGRLCPDHPLVRTPGTAELPKPVPATRGPVKAAPALAAAAPDRAAPAAAAPAAAAPDRATPTPAPAEPARPAPAPAAPPRPAPAAAAPAPAAPPRPAPAPAAPAPPPPAHAPPLEPADFGDDVDLAVVEEDVDIDLEPSVEPPVPLVPARSDERSDARSAVRTTFHEAVVVNLRAEVEVRRAPGAAPAGATEFGAVARDISRGGIFVLTSGLVVAGELVELSVLVPGEDDWSLDTHVVKAEVVRVEPKIGFGARFRDPPPSLLAAVDALVVRVPSGGGPSQALVQPGA
jgi:hypothetical protein